MTKIESFDWSQFKSNTKNPLVERVCPLCRTFGTNIKFMDLHDKDANISLTIVTCMACRGVYSMEIEIVQPKDEKPIP